MDVRFKDIDARFNQLGDRVDRVAEAFGDYQEFFVEFLTTEGVIKRDKADMVRNEAKRIMRLIRVNPLSKEEYERLKELLDKDDLTYDEAIELRDLARKIIKEYGEYPEAWKLHIYASIMVGLAMLKKGKEGEQS